MRRNCFPQLPDDKYLRRFSLLFITAILLSVLYGPFLRSIRWGVLLRTTGVYHGRRYNISADTLSAICLQFGECSPVLSSLMPKLEYLRQYLGEKASSAVMTFWQNNTEYFMELRQVASQKSVADIANICDYISFKRRYYKGRSVRIERQRDHIILHYASSLGIVSMRTDNPELKEIYDSRHENRFRHNNKKKLR